MVDRRLMRNTCVRLFPLPYSLRAHQAWCIIVNIEETNNQTLVVRERVNYGSGWVGPVLTRNFFFLENRPKIALIFWSSLICVSCVHC